MLPLLLGIGAYVAVLLTEPWAALAVGGLIYGGMLPFSARSYHRLKREADDAGARGGDRRRSARLIARASAFPPIR